MLMEENIHFNKFRTISTNLEILPSSNMTPTISKTRRSWRDGDIGRMRQSNGNEISESSSRGGTGCPDLRTSFKVLIPVSISINFQQISRGCYSDLYHSAGPGHSRLSCRPHMSLTCYPSRSYQSLDQLSYRLHTPLLIQLHIRRKAGKEGKCANSGTDQMGFVKADLCKG